MSGPKAIITAIIVFLTICSGHTQQRNTPGTVEATWNPAGIVVTKEKDSQQLQQSYYFNDEWAYGSIYMGGESKIENYPLKFDIINDRIEILTPEDVKVLEGRRIEYFVIDPVDSEPRTFINCKQFSYNSSKLLGFFEVLYKNDISLLEMQQVKIQKGYYSPTHDVGDPNDKYIVNTRYYVAEGDNIFDADSKKELMAYFGAESDEMKAYAKSNKLSFNKKEDLIVLIQYYNTLHRS